MLAARNRFHGHGSLRYLYMNGRAIRTRLFTLKFVENRRRHTPRVAIVVSKKVHKSAVGRNRMRRRVYEAIRAELPKLVQNTDIVVILSTSEIITIDSAELVAMLRGALHSADLYN